MADDSVRKLSAEQAQEILARYVSQNLGLAAAINGVTYREDFQVWEAWVSGVDGYVKAYIVRAAPANDGEWICRHITVMDRAPSPRDRDD